MVQWGGSDYSMSIGRVGESQHPDVLAAQEKVFKSAIDKGIPARAEIQSVEQAKKFLDWGVRHFSIGTDISILYNFWRENGDKLRKAMSDA
jgi:4-hydroxy-2-oxoheptanedioate aldolase